MKNKKLSEIMASLNRSQAEYVPKEKLRSMLHDFANISNSDLLEYVPVKIVACFEEYFRQLYKKIIDDTKFRVNLKNIRTLKDAKIDFDVIEAIQANTISLGDFLSYYFPCNSIEHINENFSELLGVNFLDEMRNKIYDKKIQNESPSEEKISDANDFIKIIKSIFDMRHIICHETTFHEPFDNKSVSQMIQYAIVFTELVDEIVYVHLYPNSPLTQTDMNISAVKSFEEVDQELNRIIELIKTHFKDTESPQNFGYLEKWKEYRKCRALEVASQYEGGTIYPLIYSTEMENVTSQMIRELKQNYKLYKINF